MPGTFYDASLLEMIIQYCDKLTTAAARIQSNQHKSVAVRVEWSSVSWWLQCALNHFRNTTVMY